MSCTAPQREKYWRELNDKERIERLRGVVKSLQRDNDQMKTLLYEVRSAFQDHKHLNDGTTVTPFVLRCEPMWFEKRFEDPNPENRFI